MGVFYAHPDGNLRTAGPGTVGASWSWGDTFVLGTTMSVPGTNVGAGIYQGRAIPTTTIATGGGVTLAGSTYTIAAGVTVEDRLIPGFVNLAAGARLLNCKVTGPATEQAVVRALVQGPTTGGVGAQAYVDFCTIDPTVTSSYYDGLGPTNLHVTRTVVINCTDGLRMFDAGSANGGVCNLRILGSYIGQQAQQQPDTAASRVVTHNDTAQAQGNPNGSATDIFLDGTVLEGRGSTTKGFQPPDRNYLATLMITPNVGAIHITVTRSWLRGGLHTVNCLHASLNASSSVAITNSRFERPGTDALAPSVAWSVTTGSGLVTTNTGNTYIDNGAAVSITYM